MNIDLNRELYKEKIVNEYVPDSDDLADLRVENICTVQQLEVFHKMLIMDLYKEECKINFEHKDNIEKRYFIVPLRLSEQPLDPNHID